MFVFCPLFLFLRKEKNSLYLCKKQSIQCIFGIFKQVDFLTLNVNYSNICQFFITIKRIKIQGNRSVYFGNFPKNRGITII